MKRRLDFSTIAQLDLANIHDTIAEHNASAADRLISRIETVCLMLVDQPFTGAAVGEKHAGLRFRVVGKYVIYYRVSDDAVWIQRVIHGSRDAGRLL